MAVDRSGPSADFTHGDLRVSRNRRYLVHSDGTPFFWLADTAWELFHRLNREEVELYLENRRRKGFTAVQAVVLAELDGIRTPNAYGHLPLVDDDPTKPNEAYFQHVDYVMKAAQEKGMVVGMLPTWGDKVGSLRRSWGTGPAGLINANNARAYGRFLGERYRGFPNLVWILGGDRSPEGFIHVWRELAEGLAEGDGGRHLKTYHPWGETSSSYWLHHERWLDFNLLQSGHGSKVPNNYRMIAYDYNLEPAKPCLDGEPAYEDHPIGWNPDNGWFNDFDVRQRAYYALFSGAHGHTYGCHDIWQMWQPGREPISNARTSWRDALDLPGSFDMLHVRDLMESRPFLLRVPDQSVVCGDCGAGSDYIAATRASDGSYAFVYIPDGRAVTVNMSLISGSRAVGYWYDPREGTASLIGVFPTAGTRVFEPPSKGCGCDWVLVLDDESRGFPPPGSSREAMGKEAPS